MVTALRAGALPQLPPDGLADQPAEPASRFALAGQPDTATRTQPVVTTPRAEAPPPLPPGGGAAQRAQSASRFARAAGGVTPW
ncbi:hypothetical protein [Actinacidiphila bryophytorum]|uniref:hypothetical protein n=1 Tax=Actinacidiphila bryophytorum TaxID=1436133 RepID=UPI002176D3F9|nr:hypothetical protein [Actinacidiphila bryophytorum]UWE11170.1 hypothetical protein NYE86_22275 [Actinacidiphila bryophytorum]